jgi:hypothetical protein
LERDKYILFSLNFSFLISDRDFKKKLNYLKETGYFTRGFSKNYCIEKRKDSIRMFKKFSKLIIQLSKKTKYKIIVRPHPTDSLHNYKFLKKYKNVCVRKDNSISEWIYSSKLVVHSGCTGGFEASLRGIPTIAYTPFKSCHGHEILNKYSKKIDNIKDCVNYIIKTLNSKKKIKQKQSHAEYNAFNLKPNKYASKIIAKNVLSLLKIKNYNYRNRDFLLRIKFILRDFRSFLLGNKYGDEKKFTFFDKKKVLQKFAILKEINPKFKNLKIIFLKKDIIQIK